MKASRSSRSTCSFRSRSSKAGAELKKRGFDGIIMDCYGSAEREVIVFKSSQVKSIFNRGAFDLNEERISYSIAASRREPFARHPRGRASCYSRSETIPHEAK